MEAKFKDVNFAAKAYSRVVKRVIDAGVCTGVPYPPPTWPGHTCQGKAQAISRCVVISTQTSPIIASRVTMVH